MAQLGNAKENEITRSIRQGYHSLTPYLAVDDAARAIEFYTRAFRAKERSRLAGSDGTILHAELEIGDSVVMLSDPLPQSATTVSPKQLGGTSTALMLYVEDADAVVQQAASAGATVSMPPQDMFWGDRLGQVTDPFGHAWQIATHIEDVRPEEIAGRARKAAGHGVDPGIPSRPTSNS